MSDERRRVLDMLAQGKITVDEADRLLHALTQEQAAPAQDAAKPRFLRINVHKAVSAEQKEKDVNIRVPLAIVRSGMRLGAIIPGLAGDRMRARLRERGMEIDLLKTDPALIEAVLAEMGEVNIDVDEGRAKVRITCEP